MKPDDNLFMLEHLLNTINGIELNLSCPNIAGKAQIGYDFEGIDPFTLIIVDSSAALKIYELRWDEVAVSFKQLPNDKPQIWSSATLYPKAIADQRIGWFKDWLIRYQEYQQTEIIDFHKNGGRGDLWNNFIMKRGDNLQTVSITSIEKSQGFEMVYEDLLK